MKFSVSAVLGVTAVVRAASNCGNGNNNCQRALLATKLPNRDPLADCNSYFRVTVTPATSTLTATQASFTQVTQTMTSVVTVQAGVEQKKKRAIRIMDRLPLEVRQATQSASNIPAYASPCSGAVKYSSACSCIGATVTTVTVAAPLTTVTTTTPTTQTATTTTTTTTTEACVPPGFLGKYYPASSIVVLPDADNTQTDESSYDSNDPELCCRRCRAKAGCIFWRTEDAEGKCYVVSQRTGTCPNGKRGYTYTTGNRGYIVSGECGRSQFGA